MDKYKDSPKITRRVFEIGTIAQLVAQVYFHAVAQGETIHIRWFGWLVYALFFLVLFTLCDLRLSSRMFNTFRVCVYVYAVFIIYMTTIYTWMHNYNFKWMRGE